MNEIEYDVQLSAETVTYPLTGVLHSYDSTCPYVTFVLPPELAQPCCPMEYKVQVPPHISWPYMAVGTFAVDLAVTLNADSLEVVSLDDVRPNPSLPGGF